MEDEIAKKYKTIMADPPWYEKGAGKIKRGADRHYRLMLTEQVISYKYVIENLADKNCHLYLWVTNNFLIDGLLVMKEWGFKYITIITWLKGSIGLGQYFRGTTEHCLFGRKGKLPLKGQGITGFYDPRTKHSVKPERFFEFVDKVSYPPRIELFARNNRQGWDSWGDEINGI